MRGERPARRPLAALVAPLVAPLVGTLTAALVVGWHLGAASPWRDEGATRLAAGRPAGRLLALVHHVDLVHLPYYLVAHAVLGVDGSIVALRWASAAAVAVAAGVLVSLGRRLGSTAAGLAAALLLAAAPLASRYGQEARPYAFALLAATVSARALVGAVLGGGRARWAGYAASVVALGLANVLGLLVVLAHPLLAASRGRPVLGRWAAAAGAAGVVLSPFVVATSGQAGQVSWLQRPHARALLDVVTADYGTLIAPFLLLTVAVAAAVGGDRAFGSGRPGRDAVLLGLPWGLLPPVVLWAVSQVHPLFDGRYVVAALPGVALAIGSLGAVRLPAVPLRAGLVAALVLAAGVPGLPAQRDARDRSTGHAEDVRGALALLAAHGRPGDAVLFVPWHYRVVALMQPGVAGTRPAGLDDVALAAGPVASDTLTGVDVAPADLPSRLAGRAVLLVLSGPSGALDAGDTVKVETLQRRYAQAGQWQVPHFTVTRYVLRR